jgi:hypothetical protein
MNQKQKINGMGANYSTGGQAAWLSPSVAKMEQFK